MKDSTLHAVREVFPALSSEAIGKLLSAARITSVQALVTICHEGELETDFYILLTGRVDVYKVLEGQRLLVNSLPPGSHFGEIALLCDRPRSASIVTAEPSELLCVDRDMLQGFFQTDPELVMALARTALRRMLGQEEKHLTEIARLRRREAAPATVFLSYARIEQAFVTRLANHLLKYGIDVWLDIYRIDSGRSWARQIGDALDLCQNLVIVLSPAAVASENVEDEWNYFLDQRKPVVCVLHQPCKIPYRLSKLQYIDFHTLEHDQAVARLAATLNTP